MTDYSKVLLAIAPHGNPAIRAGFAAALPECVAQAELTTIDRLGDFLAQTAHESAGFATTTEYASGKAYEGRKDLGNTAKGDGVRCKGRGLIQNTGADMYRLLSKIFGIDFYATPTKLAEFPWAAYAAWYFWKSRKLNQYADLNTDGGFAQETRRINGGYNGLASRQSYRDKARHALTDLKSALTTQAKVETTKAKAKVTTVAASTTTSGALAPSASSGSVWIILIIVLLLVAAGVLVYQARRHQSAAIELRTAAAGM